MAFSTFTSHAIPTYNIDEGNGTIKVKFDFGRKSKDCTRFGVCSMTIEAGLERQLGATNGNSAIGDISIENGRLKVEFDLSSMSATTYKKNLGGSKMLIEEDFELPSEISAALGVRAYIIKAGAYTLNQ